jgi:hypothetical protein
MRAVCWAETWAALWAVGTVEKSAVSRAERTAWQKAVAMVDSMADETAVRRVEEWAVPSDLHRNCEPSPLSVAA